MNIEISGVIMQLSCIPGAVVKDFYCPAWCRNGWLSEDHLAEQGIAINGKEENYQKQPFHKLQKIFEVIVAKRGCQ